jgi:CelD/BcsL family acetyltransferase involved in cellulose biosynthesis
MRLDIHSDPGSLTTLAPEWNRLLASARHNSIFATPEWAQTWWRSFGEGRQLCLMTVHDGQALVGVVSLFVEREGQRYVARFLGGVDVTDYEDIVAQPGMEAEVWAAAMAHLDQQPWDLDLHNVPGDSPTIEFLRRLGQDGRHSVSVAFEDVCPMINPLPPDWETYLDSLDKKDRHELRRKQRRLLGDSDLQTEITWTQRDLPQAMEDFVRLHRLSSADKSEFMTPRMVGFFNDVAAMCRQRDWLCLAFLSVQGVRVSTIMAFEYGKTLYLYNSGYDPEYEYLSAGLLLKALAIEYAIGRGLRCYDFLQGSERYKYDLGARDTQVVQIQCGQRQ